MKVLFLDDMSIRHDYLEEKLKNLDILDNIDLWHSYNAFNAIQRLNHTKFDIVSLDHDLADEHYESYNEERENTGMAVVHHIVSMPKEKRPKIALVHSMNIIGGPRMVQELQYHGITSTKVTLDELIFIIIQEFNAEKAIQKGNSP